LPLIVFEGIDGSGKSAQIEMLADSLRSNGIPLIELSDRTRPVRSLYRNLTASEETFPDPLTSVCLGLADIASQVGALHRNSPVFFLAHRYIYSHLADAFALSLDLASTLVEAAVTLFPCPDLVVHVDTSPDVAWRRKGTCTLAEAGGPSLVRQHVSLMRSFLAFQSAVRDAYTHLLQPEVVKVAVLTVDGSKPREDVHRTIMSHPLMAGTTRRKAC